MKYVLQKNIKMSSLYQQQWRHKKGINKKYILDKIVFERCLELRQNYYTLNEIKNIIYEEYGIEIWIKNLSKHFTSLNLREDKKHNLEWAKKCLEYIKKYWVEKIKRKGWIKYIINWKTTQEVANLFWISVDAVRKKINFIF